ncbi:Inorganic pyrophosphatase [Candidatus Westeberhardia cardiocondylae]|uniref:Inorganic pyrophosphatase n=1 Tax=Candidatus Westeberhardia cardiocondylae TaxID=1594731 RepID=A0A0H5BWP8_9ENTR|nr:inorganic diphosphatase [Candidatus Westeberhardia cardiocondylae]CEN32142.1 Inorganic pyrophosphatase [Candidatus Westeberhardia cardiocondylae]
MIINKNFKQIPPGEKIPEDIYVIIEISANTYPIKYEINKKTGNLFVDRFIPTMMTYPCNYGYINGTIALDKDPIDVLVPSPFPLQPGSVIQCRPIGMLNMTDESGIDNKILAVPHKKISQEYNFCTDINHFPEFLKKQIIHFFQHYKDLEENKWVKIHSWENANEAKKEILSSLNGRK